MQEKKKTLFLIIALFYIVQSIFPLFNDWVKPPEWLPSLGTTVLLVMLYPRAFLNRTIVWFGIYALVLFSYMSLGRPLTIGIGTVADSKKIIIEFAFILPALSIFSVLCYLNDLALTRRLIQFTVIVLYASFIVAVPLMLRYNSLREALYREGVEMIDVPGLPNYSLMHAYTLFLPAIAYAAKKFSGKRKTFFIVALGVLSFVVFDTFVAASLFIMVGVLAYTILFSKSRRNRFKFVFAFIIALFVVLLMSGAIVPIIDFVMPFFRGTPVIGKLQDIRNSITSGTIMGGNLVLRMELHNISWQSFFANPIFGNSEVGRHSSLVDRLGGMGLVAFVPFVMIFISGIARILKLYQQKMSKDFYWLGVLSAFLFLYFKGNWGADSWLMLFILMPFAILVYEREDDNGKLIA